METYLLGENQVPKLGFGTWQMDNAVAEKAVTAALKIGYRHLDTATAYGNLSGIGKAMRQAQLARNEIFLASKLGNQALNASQAKAEIDQSLLALQTDYLDLLLIHWPNPFATRPNYQERNAAVWQAMEEAVRAGKVRALGLSNFQPHHLSALMETAKIKPLVNQIYCNPSDQQLEIVKANQSNHLLTEAYSPLETGEIFKVKALNKLAEKYNKTAAQVVLRWHLQKGYLPLPKSVTPARMAENLHLFDFNLLAEDLAFIDCLHGTLLPYKYPDQVLF